MEGKKTENKKLLKLRDTKNIIANALNGVEYNDEMTSADLAELGKDLSCRIEDQSLISKIKNKIIKTQLEKEIKRENKIIDSKSKRGEYKKKEKMYHFITINPQETTIEEIQKIMAKLLKKEWLKIYSYVIEQRGESDDDSGQGKHLHIIADKTKSKADVIHILYASTINICENKSKIDIREMNENEMKIRYNYIRGIKKESKIKSYNETIKWREANNIKQIYNVRTIRIKEDDLKEYNEEKKRIEEEELKENKYILTETQIYKMTEDDGYIYIKNEIGEMIKYKLTKM